MKSITSQNDFAEWAVTYDELKDKVLPVLEQTYRENGYCVSKCDEYGIKMSVRIAGKDSWGNNLYSVNEVELVKYSNDSSVYSVDEICEFIWGNSAEFEELFREKFPEEIREWDQEMRYAQEDYDWFKENFSLGKI